MYRQVYVNPSQRSLQRIFWISSPPDPLLKYNLNTVTYETASTAFLSIRSLVELSKEYKDSYPQVSEIIFCDFYVDDFLTGSDNLNEARQICSNLSRVLSTGYFKIRIWISNNS